MDIQLEKKRGIQKKHLPYVGGGVLFLALVGWIIFGDHASTLKVDARGISIGEVTKEQFNDFVRKRTGAADNCGTVEPGRRRYRSGESGGRRCPGKEGRRYYPPFNSSLDLQILDAEAQLAEKQNFLRNTQVAMEQDKLNNQLEKAQLDVDIARSRRAYSQQKKLYDENLIAKEDYLKAKRRL